MNAACFFFASLTIFLASVHRLAGGDSVRNLCVCIDLFCGFCWVGDERSTNGLQPLHGYQKCD